jgi:hypothetical protein
MAEDILQRTSINKYGIFMLKDNRDRGDKHGKDVYIMQFPIGL